MTGCNGCGRCCDPPAVPPLADGALDRLHPADRAWVLSLTPSPTGLACPHFDRATRTCTDYEHRPPVCRDYPDGYESFGAPGLVPDLPGDCEFWADLDPWLRPPGWAPALRSTVPVEIRGVA